MSPASVPPAILVPAVSQNLNDPAFCFNASPSTSCPRVSCSSRWGSKLWYPSLPNLHLSTTDLFVQRHWTQHTPSEHPRPTFFKLLPSFAMVFLFASLLQIVCIVVVIQAQDLSETEQMIGIVLLHRRGPLTLVSPELIQEQWFASLAFLVQSHHPLIWVHFVPLAEQFR